MSGTGGVGHVVVAPDKFKGSLTAVQAAAHLDVGVRRSVTGLEVRLVPVSDGGDGMVATLAAAGFAEVDVVVAGPTGRPVEVAYARRGEIAVIEMAQASGLRRLPDGRLDPMRATSRGTGELIRAAIDAGCDEIILGLGGSAGSDGGAGMLGALGAGLLDAGGHDLPDGGGALPQLAAVVLDDFDPRLSGATITLATDVDTPLLGAAGAARQFGPQKGASQEQVDLLERGLARWADLLSAATGRDVATMPGAGAAGGVGFAALSALGAVRRAGIDVVLDLIGFDGHLAGAQLVITGEGSLDQQSLHGKAPVGVARRAVLAGVPTIALVGRRALSAELLWTSGIDAAYPLTDLEPDLDVCLRDAGRLLEELAARVAPRHVRG